MDIKKLMANLSVVKGWIRERDEGRGYSVSYKRIGLAFFTELVVIATSLYGAYLFTQMYGHNDDIQKQMMMLAPISYAIIELCRVPLALSIRTQRSLIIKAVAAIGVVAAMGVTVKSMSQLGEIMFRPRLFDVVKKKEALIEAQNSQDSLVKRIEDADAVVEQISDELTSAETHLTEATGAVAGLPPLNCQKLWIVTGRDRRGRQIRSQTTRCAEDPRTEAMKTNLQQATDARNIVKTTLATARSERAALKRDEVDQKLSDAQVAYKDAVLHSQLHSFTAMVFAKAPTDVADAEISWFLRIFVFLPAIFVSLASTFVAITAVDKIKPKDPDFVEINENVGTYILEPFAQHIVREATQAAERTAADAIGKSTKREPNKHEPKHETKKESHPDLKIVPSD
jgi:hypothetical protein